MASDKITLLNNEAATGAFVATRGGLVNFIVEGTFGGSTVTLAVKGPNGGVCTVAGSGLTANGSVAVYVPHGDVKAVVTGGAPANLYAIAIGVPGHS